MIFIDRGVCMKKVFKDIVVNALISSILTNIMYIILKNVIGCMNYELAFIMSIIFSMIAVFIIDFKFNKKVSHSLLFCFLFNLLNFLMLYLLELIPYPVSNIVFACDNQDWFHGLAYAIYFMYNVGASIIVITLARIINPVKKIITQKKK